MVAGMGGLTVIGIETQAIAVMMDVAQIAIGRRAELMDDVKAAGAEFAKIQNRRAKK